jgi:hypothetical protein
MTRARIHRTRTRIAVAVAVCVAATPALAGAAPPPIVGTWRWSDGDEALANPRNPLVLHVRAPARGRGLRARFGRGPWVPLAWSPATRTFTFTAHRRIGRTGARRAPVRYRGRLVRTAGTWRARGSLRILSAGYRGVSGFTAVRRG